MSEGNRRKVKHAQYSYYVETQTTDMRTGKTRNRLSRRIARSGEWVEIPRDEDVEAGEAAGAFYTDAELSPPVADDGEEDQELADDDIEGDIDIPDLVAWIRGEQGDKPNAPDVVGRAGSNPEMARALIEAENVASGNDPRRSVVEPLEKIAES